MVQLAQKLVFEDIPEYVNPVLQGQYSTSFASLAMATTQSIAYPEEVDKPSIDRLMKMAEKDPVVQQCLSLIALRVVNTVGNFQHSKKEIEKYIISNLKTLPVSFKETLFRIASNVVLYGFCIVEYTLTSKALGYLGAWRIGKFNILDPRRVQRFNGKKGNITSITYDNGNGRHIEIPYKKVLHFINQNGAGFDKKMMWGVGHGMVALNYYEMKRIVLTQLSLATKNNSTSILHVKAPNNGRTILVDSEMRPIKDLDGNPKQTTKQIALNYQLQDLYKKDYIVTDDDVTIEPIKVQSDEKFWDYVLQYIDRSIERSFNVPLGIFDAGQSGVQNVGLGQNYKSVFDTTIFALCESIKNKLISIPIKKIIHSNFPTDWFKDDFGDFIFEAEDDPNVVNQRLTTIASLAASGLIEPDAEIKGKIRKDLGLSALDDRQKADINQDLINQKIQEEVQAQLGILTTQMQLLQTQFQMQMQAQQQGMQAQQQVHQQGMDTQQQAFDQTQGQQEYQ